jgi:TldD protein
MGVRKGEVIEMSSKQTGGVGIRVLIGGAFGFASTTDLSRKGLERTLIQAEEMAKALSSKKHDKIVLAKTDRMAKGDFFLKGFKELEEMPLEQKFQMVRESEARMSKSSKQIEAAS